MDFKPIEALYNVNLNLITWFSSLNVQYTEVSLYNPKNSSNLLENTDSLQETVFKVIAQIGNFGIRATTH